MSIAVDTLTIPAAPVRGPGFYFNGVTSKRHDVIVETAANSLRIINDDEQYLVDEWNYADLRSRSAPEGILRLGRRGEAALARLEVRDAALAAAIGERASSLDRGGAADRRLRQRVVVLSLAAIASLVLTAIFGMPVLANKITPLIPLPMEKKFGEAIDKQVRPLLDTGDRGAAFQCGTAPAEAPGRKSLDKLVRQLETAANGPYRARVDVVRRKQANAFALPRPRLRVRRVIGEKRDPGRARRRHRP
jgi:hypothetical protein